MRKNTILTCLLITVGVLGNLLAHAQIDEILEAEKAILTGNAEIAACSNASGGNMVKGLSNGSANAVSFEKVNIPEEGDYFISLSYYSVNERSFSYKINGASAQTDNVKASGDWCYQGGIPADYIFKTKLLKGQNKIQFFDAPIIDRIVILADTTARKAATIYISSSNGNDSNKGLSPESAIQSISAVNTLNLLPGDSILFHSDDTFKGQLIVVNEGGTTEKPLYIGKYGTGNKPILDGDGYLSAINIVNSGYIHISNIEITNNGGPAKPGNSEELRYGLYLQNSYNDGTYFEHYRFNMLTFKNIFPTKQISDNDQTGINAYAFTTSGSWGDEIHPKRFDDMLVENCLFTRTGRHAATFKSTDNLVIRNNLFEHVGGAGMVIGYGCTNILVENNTTNHTGSNIDSRMAGRGSGIWCFRSKNLSVQHNRFMYARGIKDSYGMHIDIGNRNVVYQYNYSEGNEGGFVEILGNNTNVGYRYNLSIGDGWRKRGNQKGNIFWVAGWSGDPKNPIGSDSVFIYNNSIYVRDTITPGIFIEGVTKSTRIYNNIINVPNQFGRIQINNNPGLNDFNNNIWYGNIPATDEDGQVYRGPNSLTSNPLFKDEVVQDSTGFFLRKGSPAMHSGKLIFNPNITSPYSYFYNNGGLDYFGNSVSTTQTSNRGAYNGKPLGVGAKKGFGLNNSVRIYPNPLPLHSALTVELEASVTNKKILVRIVDFNGRIRMEKMFHQASIVSLDSKSLSRGNYIIQLIGENVYESKPLSVY